MPDPLLTLSHCFTDLAPDEWADTGYNYEDEERAAEALKFTIPAAAVPALVEHFTRAVEPRHISEIFPTLEIGQEFYRSCVDQSSIALLGIGLEPSLLQSAFAQRNDEVNQGYWLIDRLNMKQPLERGGHILGYEPLGFDGTKFHSWLCHNAPADAYEKFGIRPNELGFIDAFENAKRVTENLKATGAERGIWEPWLVVQYGID